MSSALEKFPPIIRQARPRFLVKLGKGKFLLLLFVPTLIYLIVFRYAPMYGLVISLFNFNLYKGLFHSQFVGLKYYLLFLHSPDFFLLLRNTFLLGLYRLLWTFPAPILLALVINEVRNQPLKKAVQTVSYLPYFISNAVVASMVIMLLAPTGGMVNNIIDLLGGERINFMVKQQFFRTIYVASEVWQRTGMNSIIYLAALSAIDPQLYESAHLDGANKLRQIVSITLPSIAQTVIVVLILNTGYIVNIGFEKVFLLQNAAIYATSDIISTYVYRTGFLQMNYSYATAIGVFQALIAVVFVFSTNAVARKLGDTGLF